MIKKGSTARDDLEAIRLLRRHGILSMAGHIVGFEENGSSTFGMHCGSFFTTIPIFLMRCICTASLDIVLWR